MLPAAAFAANSTRQLASDAAAGNAEFELGLRRVQRKPGLIELLVFEQYISLKPRLDT